MGHTTPLQRSRRTSVRILGVDDPGGRTHSSGDLRSCRDHRPPPGHPLCHLEPRHIGALLLQQLKVGCRRKTLRRGRRGGRQSSTGASRIFFYGTPTGRSPPATVTPTTSPGRGGSHGEGAVWETLTTLPPGYIWRRPWWAGWAARWPPPRAIGSSLPAHRPEEARRPDRTGPSPLGYKKFS